jgi:hypothetical protein
MLLCRRPGAVRQHRSPRALTERNPPPVETVSKLPAQRPPARVVGRRRQLDPPHARNYIDPKVWQREDMRRAVAVRDIGTVFRILQKVGVSQRAIAARTGQSQSEISEIIAGHRQVVSYDVLERIATGLSIPRGWMGLAYEDGVVDEPAAGDAG